MREHQREKAQSLLWSVANQDGVQAYLFGTMHVRDRSAFQLVDEVLPYLKDCEVYAAEMDLQDVDLARFAAAAQIPAQQTLGSFLSGRRYEKMRAILRKSFQIDIHAYANRHPFLIISMLTEKLLRKDHIHSLDQHLWEMAGEMDLARVGLESYEAQMDILEGVDVEKQFKNLREIARNPTKFSRQITSTVSSYEKQQIGVIYKESRRQLGKLRKVLLKDRNVVMAHRIDSLVAQGKLFSAFGAAHLAGNFGVIALLKRKGWKVKPVSIAGFSA